MNLYLKQKVFSWGDSFTVYDENGNDKYYVEGEIFTFGKKLHIYDLSGNELCFIHQKLMSFLPKYFISKNGVDVAQVIKNFTFFIILIRLTVSAGTLRAIFLPTTMK